MKISLLTLFFSTIIFVQSVVSQVNTGREYGNPKVLLVMSHLSKANRELLLRPNMPYHNFLDSIAKFLQDHPSLVAMISGHTDNKGTESYNLILSSKRAAVVAAYLIQNGASDGRVSSDGFGSAKPIVANDTESGRRKNRRVEILIHEKL